MSEVTVTFVGHTILNMPKRGRVFSSVSLFIFFFFARLFFNLDFLVFLRTAVLQSSSGVDLYAAGVPRKTVRKR